MWEVSLTIRRDSFSVLSSWARFKKRSDLRNNPAPAGSLSVDVTPAGGFSGNRPEHIISLLNRPPVVPVKTCMEMAFERSPMMFLAVRINGNEFRELRKTPLPEKGGFSQFPGSRPRIIVVSEDPFIQETSPSSSKSFL
jgi:hypothetical protein